MTRMNTNQEQRKEEGKKGKREKGKRARASASDFAIRNSSPKFAIRNSQFAILFSSLPSVLDE
jgi:hypothetical protein